MKKFRAGVDIGATKTNILLITPQGRIFNRKKIITDSFERVEPIVEKASAAIEHMIAGAGLNKKNFEGVGIGVAGQLYPDTGYIDNSPNLRWFGVQFGKKFRKRIGTRIRIANDVNAAAWGEFCYGAGRDSSNMVAIFPGSGIGGGIVVNGSLVEGATGTAGEVGHMIFRENGIKCDCGRYGCHEAYAGGMPMERRMRNAVKRGKSPMVSRMVKGDLSLINTRTIADAAEKGDPVAGKIWNEAKSSLGVMCANIVSFINPDCLVLGGGVIKGNPSLLPFIRRYVLENAVRLSAEKVKIVKSTLKGDAVAMGAAALLNVKYKKGVTRT